MFRCLTLTLASGNNKKHNIITIPVIQFIIGDRKGNNILFGRKGDHLLYMKVLCRDCDITPLDNYNTLIDRELTCTFVISFVAEEISILKVES